MEDGLEPLILDLLEWLAAGGRDYAEVMEAWRTSCPRLPVWEDANERGFIDRTGREVRLTEAGRAFLAARRGPPVRRGRGGTDARPQPR